MRRTKSRKPDERVGVYKRIESVPVHHRLVGYEPQYSGRNVWDEFCVEYEYRQGGASRFRQQVDRVGDHWRAHMRAQERHPALASPSHVEQWCAQLLDGKSHRTAYEYWIRVRRFYDWLLWHTNHPHRYSPVMLAVIAGGAAEEIWQVMVRKWERVDGRDLATGDEQ